MGIDFCNTTFINTFCEIRLAHIRLSRMDDAEPAKEEEDVATIDSILVEIATH